MGFGRTGGLGGTGVREAEVGVLGFLGCHRSVLQGMVDGVAWSVAVVFATLFRYDFKFNSTTTGP